MAFFNANSTHPFANPDGFTNLLQLSLILVIPCALLAMTFETGGNPELASRGAEQSATADQPGGNTEGKESRFGPAASGLYAATTTGTSSGAVNSAHDSFTPAGVERDGRVVGSALIGQGFEGEQYFQARPSAAGDGYDGASSSASNLGPTNPALLDGEDDEGTPDADESTTSGIDDRVRAYREANGLGADEAVPVDAVTASASALDPHISVANARLQAARVTEVRRLRPGQVDRLIERHTTGRSLGLLGEPGVDVLQLNLALDEEA